VGRTINVNIDYAAPLGALGRRSAVDFIVVARRDVRDERDEDFSVGHRHVETVEPALIDKLVAEKAERSGVAIVLPVDWRETEAPVDAGFLHRVGHALDVDDGLIELDRVLGEGVGDRRIAAKAVGVDMRVLSPKETMAVGTFGARQFGPARLPWELRRRRRTGSGARGNFGNSVFLVAAIRSLRETGIVPS
jgi:hypothetical protein